MPSINMSDCVDKVFYPTGRLTNSNILWVREGRLPLVIQQNLC